MALDRPFDEYIRCEAEIFVDHKPVRKTKVKCFLWLPNSFSEQPHFYLLVEDIDDVEVFHRDVENQLNIISVKIADSPINHRTICDNHIIKDAYFSTLNFESISNNWCECFIKYHFPKYVCSSLSHRSDTIEAKYRFFISSSEFLTTKLFAMEYYTGDIKREVFSNITLDADLGHFGIKMISTDRYIGKYESNVLEVVTTAPLSSLLSLRKRVMPIVDFILLLASFAERRRLNWYKCDGTINNSFFVYYNTRRSFFKDDKVISLLSEFSFENFLKDVVGGISLLDLNYLTRLLQSYLSGFNYSMEAKIILWTSILEKVLKNKFGEKGDKVKTELIKKMCVYTADLPDIKRMIDMRNAIAHGGDIEPESLFLYYNSWQVLIERVLLKELKWGDLSKTDVAPNASKLLSLL